MRISTRSDDLCEVHKAMQCAVTFNGVTLPKFIHVHTADEEAREIRYNKGPVDGGFFLYLNSHVVKPEFTDFAGLYEAAEFVAYGDVVITPR